MLNCIIYMDILIKFIDFRIAAINKCILLLSYHSWIDILSIVASSTNGTYRTEEYIIIHSMLACLHLYPKICVSASLPGNSAQLRRIDVGKSKGGDTE